MNISSGNQSVNFRVNTESQTGGLNVGYGATGVSSAASLMDTGTAAMIASGTRIADGSGHRQ